jgi:hypothetical protein
MGDPGSRYGRSKADREYISQELSPLEEISYVGIPSLSPLEGVFYVGISFSDPINS